MESTFVRHILVSISCVLLATLVSAIVWTISIGSAIWSSFQDDIIMYYSEAGLSIMVDANNLESLDSANLYKMMEVNRNIITDFRIENLDGTIVSDTRELLDRPTDRFSVIIRGDSSIGFEVSAEQVS